MYSKAYFDVYKICLGSYIFLVFVHDLYDDGKEK